MIQLLVKASNWKIIVPFFLCTLFFLYLFTQGQDEMSVIAGEEVTLIDVWSAYDVVKITAFFEQIQPEGRAIHQQLTREVDMIFPLAYGPFFILVFAFFLKNIFGKESKWMLLSFFPLVSMGLDYLENFNTLEMLQSFPDLSEVTVNRGSFILEMKNLSGVIRSILLSGLSLVWVVKMGKNFLLKRREK